MKTPERILYHHIEDLIKINKWAPKILKVFAEEGKKIKGRWVSISYREWAEYGINTFTFNKVIKWAVENRIVESKDAPQGGKRGKKRKQYRLHLGR